MKQKPLTQREIGEFVNGLREYARVHKLGKPTIITSHEFMSYSFCLAWKDHKKAYKLGPEWTGEDFEKLIQRLRRW